LGLTNFMTFGKYYFYDIVHEAESACKNNTNIGNINFLVIREFDNVGCQQWKLYNGCLNIRNVGA
jgi:hypothetical protein